MTIFSGSGPGEQTADGCSVDFYRQLPYLGELDDVIELISPRSTVLELGCGTGRIAAHLAARGHAVVGVDDSAAMLSHLPPTVTGVQTSIETLALAQRFDVVLLPSHLINHPEPQVRDAFVRCGARHLAAQGVFLVKRHDVDWLRQVRVGMLATKAGVDYIAESVERQGKQVRMTLVYQAFEQRWTHSFTVEALEAASIERQLAEHGLADVQWHGAKRLWAAARRLPCGGG